MAAAKLARALFKVNIVLGPAVTVTDAIEGNAGWSKFGFYAVGAGVTLASWGNAGVGYGVAVAMFGGEESGLSNSWSREIDSVVIEAFE